MKILMLGWELPPHNSGGLGVACYELAKYTANQGVDIDFVVPYDADHSDINFMRIHSATRHTPETLRILTSGAYDSASYTEQKGESVGGPGGLRSQQLNYTAFVKQLVKNTDYDIIHAHDWLTYEAGVAAKQVSRRPLIVHVHATEFDRAGGDSGNPLVHEIEYSGLLMADQIMAVSQATKDIIVERYAIPEDKIEVVHNSINPHEYENIQPNFTYRYLAHMKKQGYTVVISVGRLTLQKGLTFLLEAMSLAVSKNPKILLVVAGSGEQYHDLIEYAAQLGIADKVMFTGFIRGAAWRDAYAVGDIFVMPSISEPFGLVALEAVGYGMPVLVSCQSGVAEVMSNLLRFDFWDVNLLASQIVALAESPAFKGELTVNLMKEFSKLSWAQTADVCIRNYQLVNERAYAEGGVAV